MRQKKRFEREHQRQGFLLVLFLFGLPPMILLGQIGLMRSLSETRSAAGSLTASQAFYLAEMGVDQAIVQLRQNPSLTSYTWANTAGLATGMGTSSCTITNPGGTRRLLQGTGTMPSTGGTPGAQQTIQLVADVTPRLFEQAIFGSTEVELRTVNVDSFNSNNGPYNPLNPGSNAAVRTNSADAAIIRLRDTTVNGNAVVGQGGNPFAVITTETSVITGTRTAAAQNLALPPVTIPPSLVNLGDLDVRGGPPVVLAAGSYWFNSIRLENTQLQTTGPVTIYVSGSAALGFAVEVRHTTVAASDQRPSNVSIVVQGGERVRFRDNSTLYGTIYAPNGEVEFKDGPEMFGAVVASKFSDEDCDALSKIHFDEALAGQSLVAGQAGDVVVRSWSQ